MGACNRNFELEGIQNFGLHGKDLLFGVSFVRDVHEVAQFRRIDLLVLSSQLGETTEGGQIKLTQ